MNRWYALAPVVVMSSGSAWAKPLSDTVGVVTDTAETDPHGYMLMLFCGGLIFLVAGSLLTATIIYYVKSKKDKKSKQDQQD